MAWNDDFINCGNVEFSDKRVFVYENSSRYKTLFFASDVLSASWEGSKLRVTVDDGRTFLFEDEDSYTTV